VASGHAADNRLRFKTRLSSARAVTRATRRDARSAWRSDCDAPSSPRSKVGDLHQNRGFDLLRDLPQGRRATRSRAYLEASEHGADVGPLFRPLNHNGNRQDERRVMDPDAIAAFAGVLLGASS